MDSEPLRRGLNTLQERLAGAGGLSPLYLLGGVLTLALLVLSGLGLLLGSLLAGWLRGATGDNLPLTFSVAAGIVLFEAARQRRQGERFRQGGA